MSLFGRAGSISAVIGSEELRVVTVREQRDRHELTRA
jgi:hypothetical protein